MTRTGGYECSPTRSAVYPSGLRHRSGENAERITFNVPTATLIRHLEALLGDTPARRLEFTPELDLETAYGRRLRRHVSRVVSDFDEAGPEGISPIMLAMYEQLILTELLLNQPNTFSASLHRLENHFAPGDVKRAIDFIEAHVQLPITLTDITRAAGVPGRTLLAHFKHHCGVSPMRFLKTARLARVRDALKRADRGAGTDVTRIATEWGFTHLGRFAVEYREQFGESPSETFRRRA
jgi:AraC-like DNA-binding protein